VHDIAPDTVPETHGARSFPASIPVKTHNSAFFYCKFRPRPAFYRRSLPFYRFHGLSVKQSAFARLSLQENSASFRQSFLFRDTFSEKI